MFFSIEFFIVGVFVMAIIQISVFKCLPKATKNFLSYFALLGMFSNFLLSGVIILFTGIASIVGMLNLAGSVIYGFYLICYRFYRRLRLESRKHWIILLPTVVEDNPVKHWLF